jgi:hypothetical protein
MEHDEAGNIHSEYETWDENCKDNEAEIDGRNGKQRGTGEHE